MQHWKITALLSLWALLTALTFWWYQFRQIQPFAQTNAFFAAADLPAPPEFASAPGLKLVHFWREGCLCNPANLEHLRELLSEYRTADLQLFVVARGKLPSRWLNTAYTTLDETANAGLFSAIPSAPGLAIWDANNRLAYFGPYSVGPICSARNSVIGLVLDSLLAGQNTQLTTMAGNGCFCDWNTKQG
ncbi:DUF6436 domain-containing protein [Teredinibacter turnerae]|uniref:DUF6436 domain-containing protein n=1 Tax=Teredinibacter turnerae TaxID=2426 RepID=UPI000A536ABE|nr:DUF6436 domain-containing protein [Teredinibacter turnerae]